MPLFLDVHRNVAGAGPDEVAGAHQKDLATQSKYGVKYVRYWFAESTGTIFCLVEAPSREAAAQVHREAHGLIADEIYAVIEGE